MSSLFKPIAPWTGKLTPPSKEKRHANGGVFCTLSNAPQEFKHLIGEEISLVWEDKNPKNGWQEGLKMDILFDKEILKAKAKGNLFPDHVNGLKQVSALEILTSLSSHDDFEVIIENPQIKGKELTTHTEPIQILGNRQALVTFLHPLDKKGRKWKVQHYNPKTCNFDGIESIVVIQKPFELPGCPITFTSFKDIHLSPLNKKGWYIFGDHAKGNFLVKGIEPRVLTLLEQTHTVHGIEKTSNHLLKKIWDQTSNKKGSITSVGLYPEEKQEYWREGQTYLVLHLLGAFKGKQELAVLNYFRKYMIHKFAEMTCYLRAGHFSMGLAKVVKDAFTQELRFDINYHQVMFCHMIPRFSGSQKWHKYMGSVQTGSMFLRPCSDIIVSIPELCQNYGEEPPIDTLRSYLEKTTALARRGTQGTGGLHFDVINTCTRESGQALFHLSAEVDKIAMKNVLSPCVKRLKSLLFKIKENLLDCPNRVPFRWEINEKGKIDCPLGTSGIKKWLYSRRTRKMAFPKELQERIAHVCLKEEVPLWILKTNLIGGVVDGVEPREPNDSVRKIIRTLWEDLFSR